MKNKKIFSLTFIFIFFFLTFNVFSNEIKFEAENIETSDEDLIIATKNIVISDELNNKIFGDKLVIDKKNKIYSISENVKFENTFKNILIKSNKIDYNQKDNTIKTIGKTYLNKDDKYFVEGNDILFDQEEEIISSEKKSSIKDFLNNNIETKNFNISLQKDLLYAEGAILQDKELNTYKIKKLFYDFSEKKIIGKDIEINQDNKISDKNYLPRAKSKSLISENGIVSLNKVVYTNCKKREGCPPWMIQAEEMEHDKNKKIINYKNATFKLFDVPVLYFPKFFHPDPTVNRQSGFLTPTFKAQNSNNYLRTPYYFVLSDNTDFTFSPRFYNNQKNIYQGEYRSVSKNTNNVFDFSLRRDSDSSQTHFFTNSKISPEFDLFDFSQLKFQLQSVSNDDYLKSYKIASPLINSETTLNSKIEFEASTENLDLFLSSEVYEDLTKDKVSDKYEYIFPNLTLTKNFKTRFDGTLEMTNIGYNKLYDTNVNEKVLINNLLYKSLDSINNLGMITNYQVFLKNFNSDSKNSSSLKNKSDNNIRGLFQITSKLPLKKDSENFFSTLTPTFVAKFNPNNNKNIRNEKRQIDYNNIYSINRLSTNEILEGGESITIGNEFKVFSNDNKSKEIFGLNLAASIRKNENFDLPINSTLGKKTSNIIGQANYNLSEVIDFDYNFLLDNNLDDINYHNLKTNFKVNNFITSFEFIEENNEIGNESFIANETILNIDENKDIKFKTRKNKKTDLTEYYNLIYQYKMDCLIAAIEYNKNYYTDGELQPEESLFFSITFMPFKNTVDLPGLSK